MAEEKENQENQEKALGQVKLLIMIVMVLAVAGPFLSSTMSIKSIEAQLSKIKAPAAVEDHGKAHQPELPMAFYQPLEFLVNLGDADANHYLRATVSLGLRLTKHDLEAHSAHQKGGGGGHGGGKEEEPAEPVLFSTIKVQEPIVRDMIISVISSYTMDELVTSPGKKELKETIKNKLRAELRNEHLEVYFTAFTLQ